MSLDTPQTSSNDRLIGTVIAGRYRIVRKLGEGGMGAVYVGEQQMGTNVRKVAVKTLHTHLSHDPKILARFERECGTVSELQHPNTIQVFDFGKTDDGTLFIVMEYVEGRSVADILEKEGPMDPSRVVRILTQVCGSLAEAHARGIVHRDLKPDNVVLCERAGQTDWVEVLDFGIAKRSSEEDKEESKLTQQGMVLGTPPYMSPEQFTGKPVDARSDIYSLGIMAYEMLSGRLPFAGNTAWEWASAHMTASPAPIDLTPSGPRIPATMKAAIARALAKRPEDRFASVGEFLNAFSGATADTQPFAAVKNDAAPAGRGKTEVGTPLEMPPGAFGGPTTGPGPAFGGGPHAVPAAVAAGPAPSLARRKSGGNKAPLLAVATVLGVGSIAAIVLALRGSRPSEASAQPGTTETLAPPPASVDTAPAAATTSAPAAETHAADSVLPPLEPLRGSSPPKPAGGSTGGKTGSSGSSSAKPSTTTPSSGATSTSPATPSPATPSPATPSPATGGDAERDKICKAARQMSATNPNSPGTQALVAKCKAAGGSI